MIAILNYSISTTCNTIKNFRKLVANIILMNRLEAFTPEINRLCKIYNVKKLYAFGSILTDEYGPESDIDLIVDFANIPIEEYADNYFDFKFSLQDVFNRPVDLLEEQAIKNPYFKKAVNQQRQLVYG